MVLKGSFEDKILSQKRVCETEEANDYEGQI